MEPEREMEVLPNWDGHPNERAHAIVAAEIGKFLSKKGLLHQSGDSSIP